MVVYRLSHSRKLPHRWQETKMIGYFDSETQCNKTIDQLLMQPGFRDYPDRFCIIPCRTPDAPEETALDTVYEVTVEKEINDFDSYVSYLGVYAQEASAENRVKKCMKRIENKAGTEFYVIDYRINEVLWSEGFDVVEYSE